MDSGYPDTLTDAEIRPTPAAQSKMIELYAGADEEIAGIRLFVAGGGCDGMTYGLTYTDRPTAYDSVVEKAGFKLVVDAIALGYLQGCEIDFVSDAANPSFVFRNVFLMVGGSGTCGGCASGGF